MKVALYARYSFDNQRDSSIPDQIQAEDGWTKLAIKPLI